MTFKGLAMMVFLFITIVLMLPLDLWADKKFTVYTVNYPLTYFAERIGGAFINVVFPAPPDIDPAFWSPDTETTREYQVADLILLNGAGYEKWAQKVSLPVMRTVDTSRAFRKDLIFIESTITHSHGPGGDHSHGGTAFTTWLDFSQAAQQAESIFKALARKIPSQKAELSKNYGSLQRDLLSLDKRMLDLSMNRPDIQLLGSHPIYQYLARRYSLHVKMVMWEPDEDPGEQDWEHLKTLLQSYHAEWMIWEGEPLPASRKQLEGMEIKSTVFSPCFSRPQHGDFLSVMRQNVTNMELNLGKKAQNTSVF